MVDEGDIQQLFIATHRNLFDLDPTGYFDVSRVDGETVVARRELAEIVRRHLYEPGPAKRGLADLPRLVEPDVPVLRRPDGTAVTAAEMRLLAELGLTAGLVSAENASSGSSRKPPSSWRAAYETPTPSAAVPSSTRKKK